MSIGPFRLPAISCLLLGMTTIANAENGRYQVEVIRSGSTPQVIMLDTREGYFWTWTQTIRGSDQELRYEGKLKPGKTPGETISKTGVDRRR